MKATVEIPDHLFRQAKAAAALRGRKFKDLVEEGLRHVLEAPAARDAEAGHRRTAHELMRESSGIIDSGIDDLASNPEHMREFGDDSMGNR